MSYWQASLNAPEIALSAIETVFTNDGEAPPVLSSFEIAGTSDRRIDIIVSGMPDMAAIKRRLAEALAAIGIVLEAVSFEQLGDVDWEAEAFTHQAPVKAGTLYVHGSHHPAPKGLARAILIDGGMAFGTGQHETTLGCLLALQDLAKRTKAVCVLDIGCGSGVLSIAAAKLWRRRVFATDIDPVAVEVAERNAEINNVGHLVMTLQADGAVGVEEAYDVIVANILAAPLRELAGDICDYLVSGGTAILSGLYRHQESNVLAAYSARGMILVKRHRIGDWSTLVIRKRPRHSRGRITR